MREMLRRAAFFIQPTADSLLATYRGSFERAAMSEWDAVGCKLALYKCTIFVAQIGDPQIENRRLALRKPSANSSVIAYYISRNRLLHHV